MKQHGSFSQNPNDEVRLDQALADDAPFDICSCQFAMHYAWSTERCARTALANVSSLLRPGGIFIRTMPDAEVIMKRLRSDHELDTLTIIFTRPFVHILMDLHSAIVYTGSGLSQVLFNIFTVLAAKEIVDAHIIEVEVETDDKNEAWQKVEVLIFSVMYSDEDEDANAIHPDEVSDNDQR
ncbi:mRNA cap guanine-N7 methyltransferase 1 [Tanacetum coccineum]